jgi:hypothetical protein
MVILTHRGLEILQRADLGRLGDGGHGLQLLARVLHADLAGEDGWHLRRGLVEHLAQDHVLDAGHRRGLSVGLIIRLEGLL